MNSSLDSLDHFLLACQITARLQKLAVNIIIYTFIVYALCHANSSTLFNLVYLAFSIFPSD